MAYTEEERKLLVTEQPNAPFEQSFLFNIHTSLKDLPAASDSRTP
jgi:hypothetical protein